MKKVFSNLLQGLILFSLIFIYSGCQKDDNLKPVPDPAGTITSNISANTSIAFGNEHIIWSLWWTSPNNFATASNYWVGTSFWYFYRVSTCDLGKMNGLGNIDKIPTNGFTNPESWVSSSVACEKGHGYVIKAERLYEDQGLPQLPTGEVFYVRLYVVESLTSTSGGIMGAKIKYQYPFNQ
jgi:hypothetical protein